MTATTPDTARKRADELHEILHEHAYRYHALDEPTIRKRIEDTGSIIVGNTPQQFADQIKAEYTVYKKVVDTAHLKLD